jgi:hypothetical protein
MTKEPQNKQKIFGCEPRLLIFLCALPGVIRFRFLGVQGRIGAETSGWENVYYTPRHTFFWHFVLQSIPHPSIDTSLA